MAKKNETVQDVKPFVTIPKVPQDFDGAIAINRESNKAISYWKDEKAGAISFKKEEEARLMLQKWRRVAEEAEGVIKGYQPSLF